MKQVIIKKGKAVIENVPAPVIAENTILVKVAYSCISAGTEMSGVKSSKESLIHKAIRQPQKIKMALDMLMAQGLGNTLNSIKNKMEGGLATGYSIAGEVMAVGDNIRDLKTGDRVACAGSGYANHAEYVEIPRNLTVKVPANLSTDLASTVTLGAIAMQGVRRADVKIGETVAVFGLGILGQITVEILKASGCKVIGIDLDERRIKLAQTNGLYAGLNPANCDCVKEAMSLSHGYGVDSVIITAATGSSEPLSSSFKMCRRRGRVILVGTVGPEFNREDMYKNELDFYISTSYGPGRYDENYEEKGIDYPYGYVRWTENRNMQAYLELLADGKVNIRGIIEQIYPIDEAEKAFDEFNSSEKPLIVLLKYDESATGNRETKVVTHSPAMLNRDVLRIALVGAGGFAKGVHLPNLLKLNHRFQIHAIMSRNSFNAKKTATEYKAQYATTNYEDILNDKDVDLVMICTRHGLHADLAMKALHAGKAVFLEKPMAISEEELLKLIGAIDSTGLPFMVGFNRRFSRYAVEAKKHIDKRINPLFIHYRMNAGYLPLNHWTHEDGGRIIGEACHIIDLMGYFTGSPVKSISSESLIPATEQFSPQDNKSIILKYEDGSVATIEYFAVGNKSFPKEYCEIHFDEKTLVIDDYRNLTGYGIKTAEIKSKASEKGQYEELLAFYDAIKSGLKYPIPVDELIQTTQSSLVINQEA